MGACLCPVNKFVVEPELMVLCSLLFYWFIRLKKLVKLGSTQLTILKTSHTKDLNKLELAKHITPHTNGEPLLKLSLLCN